MADAGTKDLVGVSLSSYALPGYNHTGLDYAPRHQPAPFMLGFHQSEVLVDDFSRNSDFTYDLRLDSIRTLHDISQVRIHKYGTDGMCIHRLDLLVNGGVAYTKSYGAVANCHWIDGDDGRSPELVVGKDEVRQAFATFQSPQPTLFVERVELESRIEGLLGSIIWNDARVDWGKIHGDRALEVSRADLRTLRVDADFIGHRNWAPDPEVDIDFDLRLAFVANADDDGFDLLLDVENKNAGVDVAWWAEAIAFPFGPLCGLKWGLPDCVTLLEDYIEQRIEAAFTLESARVPFASRDELERHGCTVPTAEVQADGGLLFGCT